MKQREIEDQYFYIADILVILLTQYFIMLISEATGQPKTSIVVLIKARTVASYLMLDASTLNKLVNAGDSEKYAQAAKEALQVLYKETDSHTLFHIEGHELVGEELRRLIIQTAYQHELVRRNQYGQEYHGTGEHKLAQKLLNIYGEDIKALDPHEYQLFIEKFLSPKADNFLTPFVVKIM